MYGHIRLQGVVGDPIRAPLVNVCTKPCNEPDSINIADGIQVSCGVAPSTSAEYDVILRSEISGDLSQLPVASVCNVQVCVDEVNECDDNCEVKDFDIDDDEVSPRVRNVDDIVSSCCVNDDVLRPVHTVDDGDVSASDVKGECEVVGDDKVDDNLGRVHTVDGMTDECVDESDGLDGRMNDCLSNCCRDVSSYLM